ncbi:lipopolysaccharide biosynthesis protein [Vibrio genomosp. F10]|uniref:lipopolysaccharide biosynthesis protein n=1 Tax=Vibrio genomosp. F10 TaxID=723171 RepID=UPI00031D30CE|nr:oligosaccharide flippase family protein [Vibrio genomosp. F10]OEF05646.1 hypothetical protein A1QI_07670 [Vibrio genomosp. F10 str. 9ZB36]
MIIDRLPSSLKNMLTYAVSIFLVKGISLIMLPIMALFLSPAQLGKLELLATTTVFLSLLVGLAMHENLYRFVGELKCKVEQFNKVSQLYTYAVMLSLMVGSIVTIVLFLLPPLQSVFTVLDIALLCTVLGFESALGISMAWLRFKDRATSFLVISVVSTIFQVSAIVVVLYIAPVVTYIYAVGVLTGLLQLVILHKTNGFTWSWGGLRNLNKLLKYSFPLMLSTLVAFGLTGAEKWIIGYSFSIETLGLYAVAAKFSLAMCILIQPFSMWWMPKRFNALLYRGNEYTARVTQCGFVYITILAISAASVSQLFITWALPSDYFPAVELLTGVIIVALFKELSDLFNIGILQQKKTQLLLVMNVVCTLVGLGLCLTLSSYGIWGIIGSISFAQGSRAAALLYFSQRLVKLPFQFTALLLILINTLSCLALGFIYTHPVWLILITLFGAIFNLAIAYRYEFLSVFDFPRFSSDLQRTVRGS